MGLLKDFFNQTRKLEGFLGKLTIKSMNQSTHAVSKKFETIIDGMRNYTIQELSLALKRAGFSMIKSEHHAKKPWIVVLAKKQEEKT